MTNCIYCGSGRIQDRGDGKGGGKRHYCRDCRKFFTGEGAPKILLVDIETAHMLFRGWDTGDQYVRPDQIVHDWFTLCWSAKWLFGDIVMGDVVTPREALKRDDKRIIYKIHPLLDMADIVIAHNGDKFDLRKLNWRFMKYGLRPNNKYHSIDTLKKSRQVIDPPSHGLDSIGKELGFGHKDHMVEQDWLDCEAGDPKALKKMSTYCNRDVYLLEDWYLYLRPWMKTHPNLAPYVDMYRDLAPDETTCPRCLNTLHDAVFGRKWRSLAAGKLYKSGSCSHCGTQLRINY